MPEAPIDPEGANLLTLQRSLAALAFGSDPSGMRQDPVGFARSRGLPPEDQAAFHRHKDRLLAYREFIRNNLTEPIDASLPITKALLDKADSWDACLDAFLETRSVTSPFYRDIAATFLGWLAATGWGQERWPFLLELAHCELLQLLVAQSPDHLGAAGLHARAQGQDRLVLDPSAQVVTYRFAVHLATVANPEPETGTVHLLVYRDQEGRVRWKCLTPATAALLVGGQVQPLLELAQALGLPKPSGALDLVDELCALGAIQGFKTFS